MNHPQHLLPKRTTFAVTFSVLSLIIANLFVSNILATTGEKVRAFETRKENLIRQNEVIRQAIVKQKTLSSIEERAEQLGMTKIQDTLSLTKEPPVAMKNP
jgi:hypothetical protein